MGYTRCSLGVARTRAPPVGRPPRGLIPTDRRVLAPACSTALSDRLRKTLAGLTGRGRVTEADVDAAMREVRLALLEADVNFKVVKDFVARVRERAIGADILESLTAGQQVVKIVNEELTALLSAGDRTFHLLGNPAVIALVGLQGSGKTTTAAKLAKLIVKQGRRPLLVAADPYRPAAADQLETLGKASTSRSTARPSARPTVDIARQGIEHAKRIGRDVVIIDTAGRLTIDDALMDEIRAVARRDEAGRDAARRRRDDRPGGRDGRRRASRTRVTVDRAHADEDRRRRPRRRGPLDRRGRPASRSSSSGTGEKTDALEVFHPGPPRGPDPGHGRRPDARRAGPGGLRRQAGREARGERPQGRVHPRGHALVHAARCRRWARWASSWG